MTRGYERLAPMDAISQFAADWQRLWAVAESQGEPQNAFDPIGLLLEMPGEPSDPDYDATPVNAVGFASTGGDGVHFGAVPQGDNMLIVMTVPMMWERPNVVVGADLMEFLSLGCRYGYFALEQLVYDRSETEHELQSGEFEAATAEADGQLALLRRHFSLSPWPRVHERLQELERFAGDAVLPRREL